MNSPAFDDENIDLEYTAPGHDNALSMPIALVPGSCGGACMECELVRSLLDGEFPSKLFTDKSNHERLAMVFEAVRNYNSQLESNARQITAAWEENDNLRAERNSLKTQLQSANETIEDMRDNALERGEYID